MPYVTAEIEVDLDDFSDKDLIEELQERGIEAVSEELTERMERLYSMCISGAKYDAIAEYAHDLCRDALGKAL